MSIECSKCKNKVFDSKAYLKISPLEKEQQELVDSLSEELKQVKEKYGKKSDEAIELQSKLNIEKRILKTIWKCKNALYL